MTIRAALALTLLLAAPAAAQAPRKAPPRAAGLPLGEYACYGSGMQVLAGLGFKLLPGGRYTDLDGKSPGTYVIGPKGIAFRGGHLDGQNGRELTAKGFRIGAQASCEKW